MLLVEGLCWGLAAWANPAGCVVPYVRFHSVDTNKATTDTQCTEPHHGISGTPCDRLGRNMLEALGSALYRQLKGLGSGDLTRSPTPTYKKRFCFGSIFCVLCGRPPRQHAGRAPFPRKKSRVGGGALLPTSWLRLVVSARRATTTSRPPAWVAYQKYKVKRVMRTLHSLLLLWQWLATHWLNCSHFGRGGSDKSSFTLNVSKLNDPAKPPLQSSPRPPDLKIEAVVTCIIFVYGIAPWNFDENQEN